MRAPPEYIPDEYLQASSQPFVIWSKLGWGGAQWHVVRVSDRRVMKSSPDLRKMLRWVKAWGDSNLD